MQVSICDPSINLVFNYSILKITSILTLCNIIDYKTVPSGLEYCGAIGGTSVRQQN